MSSLTSAITTYRIALFQGGLADNGNGFDETISKLDLRSLNVVASGEKLNMTHFNPANQAFYRTVNGTYSKSSAATDNFNQQIVKIVDLAKENVGKTILVGTFLNHGFNTSHNLDTIENQKTKLCYIIDAFKKYNNVELILVGHSQGGLVNLEAAISRNTKISKLISLSTPYAPVHLAKTLLFLEFVFNLGGKTVYNTFVNKAENIPAYDACVETLSSSDYFEGLKNRWNALSVRPQLTVITGTAGHLFNVIPATSTSAAFIYKEPFDGIVKISEQKAISHATFIDLVNNTVPCYAQKTYADSICSTQQGLFRSCDYSCTLKSLSISGTIFDALMSYVKNALHGNKELTSLPVADAVLAGLKRDKTDLPDNYDDYYAVYSNAYNHNFIRYNWDALGHLLVLLTT